MGEALDVGLAFTQIKSYHVGAKWDVQSVPPTLALIPESYLLKSAPSGNGLKAMPD